MRAPGATAPATSMSSITSPSALLALEGLFFPVPMGTAITLGGFSRNCTMFAKDAKVRLGLRTIVEAKHGDDVALKLGRQIDASFTNPIACAVYGFLRQRDAEGALEIGDGSGELHGAASRCRRAV